MSRTPLALAVLLTIAGCATSPTAERDDILAQATLQAQERLAVGAAFEREGNLLAARREYRAAIVAARDSGADADTMAGIRAVALTNLGNTHLAEGHRVKASWLYRQALIVDPTYGVALNNLAMVHLEEGRTEEAIELLHLALSVDPANRPHYLTSLAQAHRHNGDRAQAEKLLREVLDGGQADESLLTEALGELAEIRPEPLVARPNQSPN